jgi:hypothetical protein
MPQLRCLCGFVRDLTPIPDDGWITVRDKDYEALLAAEARRHRLARAEPDSKAWDDLIAADREVIGLHGLLYECPACGRILWQKPGEAAFRIFSLERDTT